MLPLDVAAGHVAGELGGGERAARKLRHYLAIAHHGAPVGDGDDLVEAMGDVEDRDAGLLQAFDHREEARHLALLQRSRRLVENEHARIARERPRDGDRLALGEGQLIHPLIEIERQIEPVERVARERQHARAVEPPARQALTAPPEQRARRQVAEHHVLGDREGGDDAQLLADHRDAARVRVGGRPELDGLAVHKDAPRLGPVDAAEDLDQRRLAGAVLAHERVHLARRQVELHVIQRHGGVEALAEILRGEHGSLDHG